MRQPAVWRVCTFREIHLAGKKKKSTHDTKSVPDTCQTPGKVASGSWQPRTTVGGGQKLRSLPCMYRVGTFLLCHKSCPYTIVGGYSGYSG